MAAEVFESDSGFCETEVTSRSNSSSRLIVLSTLGGWGVGSDWARVDLGLRAPFTMQPRTARTHLGRGAVGGRRLARPSEGGGLTRKAAVAKMLGKRRGQG